MELELGKIGNNIRVVRVIRGYSQEGLAQSVGKSQNWMQKVEKGEIDLTITSIQSLATQLGVLPNNLISLRLDQLINPTSNVLSDFVSRHCIFRNEVMLEQFINKIIEERKGRL